MQETPAPSSRGESSTDNKYEALLRSGASSANSPVKRKGTFMARLGAALADFVTPKGVKETQAAIVIQCAVRTFLAHNRVHYLRTMRRLVALMASQELRYALLIQHRWRSRQEERRVQELTKIQAAAKGRIERRRVSQQRKVSTFSENRAAKVIQRHGSLAAEKSRMMKECRGLLEKQGRKYAIGKWEMVVWQERYAYLSKDALVYRHVKSATAEPTGAEKAIPYASLEEVKALLGDTLYLRCNRREYHFQLGSAEECETWATNIVQLAMCAGYEVPGYVVLPPEAWSEATGEEAEVEQSSD
eukprot:Transcript_24520.p1 GENE.Transcript_24520~~Transcript_24520.p1  ORF type:complete len:302 (-),score=111.25 Transcript_24520:544-1449(-)